MGPLLSVLNVKRYYEVRRSVFSVAKETIRAVDDVSFDLWPGKTLGVVGESGSGKSTLARCVLFLERADSGQIIFDGVDILNIDRNGRRKLKEHMKKLRRQMQIIFQDPYSSLNPRMNVRDSIAEPLRFHGIVRNPADMKAKIMEILNDVGLTKDFLDKFPHEMSGGQRQRVAIGRALATSPSLLIADEPVSSLDVSIQAQIINLFLDIRQKTNIAMIFVSHDLNIVRFISDDIIVLYRGKVVERGTRDQVFLNPRHPYTKMLIAASQGKLALDKEPPTGDGGEGCPFYEKCSEKTETCRQSRPELTGNEDHQAACFSK